MSQFSGFVTLEDTFTDHLQVVDADKQPVAPDAAPTWRVYGASGILANAGGTTSLAHTGTITGVTNANPAVVTSANHNLQTGQRVTISGVVGATGVNGTNVVTRIDANSFSVPVAAGGAYVSGGTFNVTGFYKASIVCTGANGFEAGEAFFVHYSWAVGGASRAEVHGLGVT